MTENQFRAWLKVKLENLAAVCDNTTAKPTKLLSRLSDIAAEAEQRAPANRRSFPAEPVGR